METSRCEKEPAIGADDKLRIQITGESNIFQQKPSRLVTNEEVRLCKFKSVVKVMDMINYW